MELQAYLREGCQEALARYKSTMNVKAAAGDPDTFYVIVRPALRDQDSRTLEEQLKNTFTSVVIGQGRSQVEVQLADAHGKSVRRRVQHRASAQAPLMTYGVWDAKHATRIKALHTPCGQ